MARFHWIALAALLSLPTYGAAQVTEEVFVLLRQPAVARSAGPAVRRGAVDRLQRRVVARIDRGTVEVSHKMQFVSGFTAVVDAAGRAALLADPEVIGVESAQRGGGGLGQSVPLIRAHLPQRRGYDGTGVTLAVLDSGIESTHPDVVGRIVGEQCFCLPDCCPNHVAQQAGPGSAATRQPHGIHVTGIAASAGHVAEPGVAPRVNVVSVKVLDENNRGFLSDWLAGLDWILAERPDVQVINMSLVSDAVYLSPCDQQGTFAQGFAQAFEALRQRGVATFVASGNNANATSLTLPACVEAAIAVGAVTKRDAVWSASNGGAGLDLLAPGVGIVSDGVDGSVTVISGTSMAAPHAAGAAAALLTVQPDLEPDILEALLQQTGVPILDQRNGRSVPRIDVSAAFRGLSPLLGGGSGSTDCLATWEFETTIQNAPIAEALCRDGDRSCDQDLRRDYCGVDVRLCFGRPDGRLPQCTLGAGITEARWTSPAADGDAIDQANRAALLAAMPPLPISEATCGEVARLTLPIGSRWLRLTVVSPDGRRDRDRLRLRCEPRL